MTPETAKITIFTSKYPPDKIVDIYTGSFTATKTSSSFTGFRTEHVILHSFGVPVFLDMTWSQDNGATWQPVNSAVPDTSSSSPVFQTCEVGCYSTATEIVVVASNYTTTSRTILFKVAAFWMD